jgi:hypothetical protein
VGRDSATGAGERRQGQETVTGDYCGDDRREIGRMYVLNDEQSEREAAAQIRIIEAKAERDVLVNDLLRVKIEYYKVKTQLVKDCEKTR